MEDQHKKFMRLANELAEQNVLQNLGTPFGAIVVKDGEIVAKSANKVALNNDPTAHAEIAAIRLACIELKTFDLTGCVVYTSCEPCPMCLGALYWSKVSAIYYGNTKQDAANANFDDQFIYDELDKDLKDRKLPIKQLLRDEAQIAFKLWDSSPLNLENAK